MKYVLLSLGTALHAALRGNAPGATASTDPLRTSERLRATRRESLLSEQRLGAPRVASGKQDGELQSYLAVPGVEDHVLRVGVIPMAMTAYAPRRPAADGGPRTPPAAPSPPVPGPQASAAEQPFEPNGDVVPDGGNSRATRPPNVRAASTRTFQLNRSLTQGQQRSAWLASTNLGQSEARRR
jgi:hypothetical protein